MHQPITDEKIQDIVLLVHNGFKENTLSLPFSLVRNAFNGVYLDASEQSYYETHLKKEHLPMADFVLVPFFHDLKEVAVYKVCEWDSSFEIVNQRSLGFIEAGLIGGDFTFINDFKKI
jgi:hypothetical protein